MTVVADASLVLAFAFDDERTTAIDEIGRQISIDGAFVPRHWQLEVANGVMLSVRRKRIDEAQAATILAKLAQLRVMIDVPDQAAAWTSVYTLAERHWLTVYDAAYLELAMRRGLPLASLDRELVTAARACGVEVLTS